MLGCASVLQINYPNEVKQGYLHPFRTDTGSFKKLSVMLGSLRAPLQVTDVYSNVLVVKNADITAKILVAK